MLRTVLVCCAALLVACQSTDAPDSLTPTNDTDVNFEVQVVEVPEAAIEAASLALDRPKLSDQEIEAIRKRMAESDNPRWGFAVVGNTSEPGPIDRIASQGDERVNAKLSVMFERVAKVSVGGPPPKAEEKTEYQELGLALLPRRFTEGKIDVAIDMMVARTLGTPDGNPNISSRTVTTSVLLGNRSTLVMTGVLPTDDQGPEPRCLLMLITPHYRGSPE